MLFEVNIHKKMLHENQKPAVLNTMFARLQLLPHQIDIRLIIHAQKWPSVLSPLLIMLLAF